MCDSIPRVLMVCVVGRPMQQDAGHVPRALSPNRGLVRRVSLQGGGGSSRGDYSAFRRTGRRLQAAARQAVDPIAAQQVVGYTAGSPPSLGSTRSGGGAARLMAARIPRSSAVGEGGQPGIVTSTGRIFETAPIVA